MNEWFKKMFETIKLKWTSWKLVQRGIAIGVVVVVIAAIVAMVGFSSKPASARIWDTPVTDETERSKIISRLNQDNIKVYVTDDGYLSVDDEVTAKRYRATLIAEGLAPSKFDAYQLFDVTKWTRNDFDDRITYQRATTAALQDMLQNLSGIQRAEVMLNLPEESLFVSSQNPVSVSVILYARGGSDVLENRNKIKSIQNLIRTSVQGLRDENITIMDGDTQVRVNDFEGLEETDRISNIQRQQKLIREQEAYYTALVLNALKGIYGERVRVANMKIDMDMSKKTITSKEYSGVTIKADNPDTPYDDSEIRDNLIISSETVTKEWTGTGYNPEGPAGVEGQNPPVYSDASNVIGKSVETGVKQNNALNEKNIVEEVSPITERLTVSVNIDGKWNYPIYDENGKLKLNSSGGYYREYIPMSAEELEYAKILVQNAVGYKASRGDDVTVTNIAFNRDEEFRIADEAFRKAQQTRTTILWSLVGVAVVLIAFILIRLISREVERRKRLREEELLRKQQAEREQALWDAQEQGMEVTMSVEERKRAELQENALALAKEHPEDVAMLLRTWLVEEN